MISAINNEGKTTTAKTQYESGRNYYKRLAEDWWAICPYVRCGDIAKDAVSKMSELGLKVIPQETTIKKNLKKHAQTMPKVRDCLIRGNTNNKHKISYLKSKGYNPPLR